MYRPPVLLSAFEFAMRSQGGKPNMRIISAALHAAARGRAATPEEVIEAQIACKQDLLACYADGEDAE